MASLAAPSAPIQPRSTWQTFRFATILTAVIYLLVGAFYRNYLFAVITLSAIEITLSSDNAVMNAKYLTRMDERWRRRFLFWGLPIAVLGMRLFIPVIIVSLAGHMGPWTAFMLALHNPVKYGIVLESARPTLVGFGGAFLFMIAVDWALEKRQPTWIRFIEDRVARLEGIEKVSVIITLVTLIVVDLIVHGNAGTRFLVAGIIGAILYLIVNAASNKVDEIGESNPALRGGVLFVFLEILDASCSFDGVMGAFAITTKVIPIAIGLGVGALWVRSMSIYAVEHDTLGKLPFLEHGAHYAIFALAVMLFGSLKFNEPDWLTGSIGLAFIGMAVFTSLRYRKSHPLEAFTRISDELGRVLERPKLAAGLARIFFGLGWDVAESADDQVATPAVDMDASAIAFNADGQVVRKCYFRDLGSPDGWFFHTGDDPTGGFSTEGDDERIAAYLQRLSDDVTSVVLTVTIKSNHTLDDVEGAYCRVVDAPASIELDEADEDLLRSLEMERINLTLEGGDATGKIVGRLYRKRGRDGIHAWHLQPLDEDIPVGRTIDDPRVLAVAAAAATGSLNEIQRAQERVLAMTADENAPVI